MERREFLKTLGLMSASMMLADNLRVFRENHWGWAIWNLRGSFGILDSGRRDVDYEDFHGHKLDRKMLEVLLSNK